MNRNNMFENEQNESTNINYPVSKNNNMNMNMSYDFNANSLFKNDLNDYFNTFMQKTKHPYVCLTHIFFKLLSVILYFIGPFIFRNEKSKENDFIVTFAITLFLVSLDFYLVKNITGRFLVKMIWWIDANPDYSNKIVFQSSEETSLNNIEKNIFWYALYAYFLIWLMQTIQMLMSLQLCWFLLCCTCLFLSFYNLFNFWQCSKEQRKVVANIMSNVNLNYIYNKIFYNM
ncbi:golgi apparatus membrane protein TVP23, putative [Plasmodium vinckei brucechwatti]|uniref:Golgi apparatus membrane protein TVP23 homolog n=1 Tax=Plasmodium vinckei brucechwatti TaxID=119398 RepID=A0A6V7SPH0_PLAVN|nr:golgi apparatus membrane protein TVP23, putative [Plasmodium vinckei brucechwatti]